MYTHTSDWKAPECVLGKNILWQQGNAGASKRLRMKKKSEKNLCMCITIAEPKANTTCKRSRSLDDHMNKPKILVLPKNILTEDGNDNNDDDGVLLLLQNTLYAGTSPWPRYMRKHLKHVTHWNSSNNNNNSSTTRVNQKQKTKNKKETIENEKEKRWFVFSSLTVEVCIVYGIRRIDGWMVGWIDGWMAG